MMEDTSSLESAPSRMISEPSLTLPVVSALVFIGQIGDMLVRSTLLILRGKVDWRDAIKQMDLLGVGSLPIVFAITFSTGIVYALYSTALMVQYGAGRIVGGTISFSFVTELGPMLAGVAMAARVGSAIAAEIGTMVVTEQVDALRAMAVSPVRYLIAPRLLACLLMAPAIGLVAIFSGIWGGMIMSAYHGVPIPEFLDSARRVVFAADLWKGVFKVVWFAVTVSIVACQQGLVTTGGAAGVGKATTRSVVLCVLLVFLSDVVLAQILGVTRRV